jgi:hypothetical protein
MRIGEATSSKDLIVALEEARVRREQLRRPFETVWWNNIALVAGDHTVSWNATLGQYDTDYNIVNADSKRKPMLVLNHALTVARTELAKLTKSKPVINVLANSDEAVDLAAAKVGNKVVDALEWKFKLAKLRQDALWWMVRTGLGAIYVGWNPDNQDSGTMDYWIDPQTKEAIFDELRVAELNKLAEQGELAEEVKKESHPLGELDFKVYSPFQLLPTETARNFSEVTDLITSDVLDIDVARGIWPQAKLDPERVNAGALETRLMQRSGLPTAPTNTEVADGCVIYTWWCLPGVFQQNKYLADGKMIRWTKGNFKPVEETQKFPFADKRLPFAFYEHIPSGVIWPEDTLRHIRGANLEIDRTVSQLIENKDYMANPMWLLATQHRVKGGIKNVAGSVIRYTHVPNLPLPQPVPGMQMPSQVENIVVALRSQILDISGQSEVTRGRVPTGIRSGSALSYLQEEDDAKIAPTVDNMEQAIALMGSLALSRVGQYYSTQRIISYYRRDGEFDVVRFRGADLKGNTDVVPQSGSAMPKSKAARQAFIIQLAEMGLEKDPRRIKEVLDIGEGEPDDVDKSIAQANRENMAMLVKLPGKKGATAIPVKQWHNHEVHLSRHTSKMMDEEFDQMAVAKPEIVRLFDEHITMHQKALQEQQQQQLQMMLAARGGPDGPPGNTPTTNLMNQEEGATPEAPAVPAGPEV